MSAQPQALSATASETPANWEALYTRELPRVYNFFRYRVGDEALAEDLTAATFEKAWRARDRYRHDLGAFSTWLFTIARRVAVDHFRRRRPEVPLEAIRAQAGGSLPEDIVQRRRDFARLATLLAALPERERELVALKYGADLNNREVARLTGLSESNVGTLLHRTVLKLRQAWEADA
jgi:RNA polymerase sigma-70 factor (ECF subfamily)